MNDSENIKDVLLKERSEHLEYLYNKVEEIYPLLLKSFQKQNNINVEKEKIKDVEDRRISDKLTKENKNIKEILIEINDLENDKIEIKFLDFIEFVKNSDSFKDLIILNNLSIEFNTNMFSLDYILKYYIIMVFNIKDKNNSKEKKGIDNDNEDNSVLIVNKLTLMYFISFLLF